MFNWYVHVLEVKQIIVINMGLFFFYIFFKFFFNLGVKYDLNTQTDFVRFILLVNGVFYKSVQELLSVSSIAITLMCMYYKAHRHN